MSTSQPTLDDIWQLFKESDRKFREMAEETKQQFRETDRKFREMVEERKQESLETDRKLREISRETDRKIREVSESIGRLGNKLGDFVEGMVRPAAVRLFRERGIDVHEVHQNVNSQRGEELVEIDLLVVNDADVVAVECKSTLSVDDVNEHLARLAKAKRLLPAYADKRIMGAVAAMVLPDDVARYAYRQGLFVIVQTGDHLTVRNDAVFRPKVW
ncbi:hypothetical protein [Methylosarcina fibrata]|uniref:hypothetical protein n=1 Tax=Methylosarcina fibrata TaxID=105972 RepID=UPI00039DF1CD|nr:hypothetical protein [Methylosarcina fibrata]